MLYDPLLEPYGDKKQAIDAQRDNRKQIPFDIVSEKLNALTVKAQAFTFDYRVRSYPSRAVRHRPGQANAQRYKRDQKRDNASDKVLKNRPVKIRSAFTHLKTP
jgi:hypothetical protein